MRFSKSIFCMSGRRCASGGVLRPVWVCASLLVGFGRGIILRQGQGSGGVGDRWRTSAGHMATHVAICISIGGVRVLRHSGLAFAKLPSRRPKCHWGKRGGGEVGGRWRVIGDWGLYLVGGRPCTSGGVLRPEWRRALTPAGRDAYSKVRSNIPGASAP